MDNLKSLVSFWDHLAEGLEIPSIDRSAFRLRALSEGLPFLTKTLASYGKALDKHLITGEPLDFSSCRFKRDKDTGKPVFLSSLIRGYEGAASFQEAAEYIKKVRQLTLVFYKLEVPYDETTLDRALTSFIESDLALGAPTLQKEEEANLAKTLKRILCKANPLDIWPRHSSGAVANKLRQHQKWHTFRYIPRLDRIYPYDSHFFYNVEHVSEELETLLGAEVVDEPRSRLVFVPKDSRGPRLICCEPAEFQYIQQGLKGVLYNLLESHHETRGFVNFTDQSVNQRLARESSLDGSLATLDLSEASDRVDWTLLMKVLPKNWVEALGACRSTHVEFPNGTVYGPLRKFAPMGSACCFPVESLFFWALLQGNLHTDVWVYGDDIILDANLVPQAISLLERAGLKVNADKSCYRTPFRESCGADYFAGFDVGYVKLRRMPVQDYASFQHYISFAQLFAEHWGLNAGLKALSFVDSHYRVVPTTRLGPRPGVFYHAEAPLARNDVFYRRRWNTALQYYEHKILSERTPLLKLRTAEAFHRREMLRKTLTRDKETEPGCYPSVVPKSRWTWVPLL